MQAWAEALPNALTPLTWQELCQQWGGQPVQRGMSMLHTWNWIPHPQGAFVHENPAIPFLRASLSVPSQEFLDSADGQAALATLRLVHGEVIWRYRRAFPVVNATPAQRQQTEEIVADAVRRGTQALAQMRTSEAQREQQLYLEGARSGAQAWAHMHQNVLGVFSPAQQEVLAAFLASLHERKHTPGEHQHSAGR
jgi:hypothetical protein